MVVTPRTAPSSSTRGPPLEPGLMAAVVWMKVRPDGSRRTPLIRPSLSVLVRPSGLPMA